MSNAKKPTMPWLRVRPRRLRVKWEPRRANRRRTQNYRRQANVNEYLKKLVSSE